jgi:hypothetical protein
MSFASSSPFLIASGRRRLTLKAGTKIGAASIREDMELDIAALLDTGALTNGKDYYVFLSQGTQPISVRISFIKNAPQGFILIGGFHTLCVSAGTGMTYVEGAETKDHPLNGYLAGDILPYSVWCLNRRPFSEPEGMVYIPSLDFWCDIYLQSGSGKRTKSVYQGALTRLRQYVDHVEDMFCVNKELLDDGEFAAAMLGSNEMTAVMGASDAGATTGGAGGRADTANRRMISVYGVEEGCGSLWQWLRTTGGSGIFGRAYRQTSAQGVTPPTYGYDPAAAVGGDWAAEMAQSGGKGSFYGLCIALVAGGYWVNDTVCGSRARSAISTRSRSALIFGGRGRSRCIRSAGF